MQLHNLQPQPSSAATPAAPDATPCRVTVTVGVLLDARIQERWVLDALRRALAVPGVRLGAMVLVGPLPQSTPAALAHRAVDAVDYWLRCRDEPLFAPVDVVAALSGRAPLQLRARCEEGAWRLDSSGAAVLRAAQVDAWLCFTALPPRAPVPQLARHGLWGLEIGPRLPAVNRWAGATEICAGSAVTVAQLVDYTRGGGSALHRTCAATVTNSARRNRLLLLRTGMDFFRRELALLTQPGPDALAAGMRPQLPVRYPDCATPSWSGAARLSWQLLSRVAGNRWQALGWRNQWCIGYYFTDESADIAQRPAQLHRLVPPADRDWADPFLVEQDGRRFVFFEELPNAAGKGHISAIEIGADGTPGAARQVLARPYHLSYPFLFRWNGALYMLPETHENGTVELYRCERFPDRWSLHQVLLSGLRACDAALVPEQGRWWMFVNVAGPGEDLCQQLHLYSSDSPLGPWRPHAANPVISDARRARGAGPLFRRDGVLYRPSQDCSAAYGYAVSINRVDVLDPLRYEETPVRRLTPDWDPEMRCLHTFGALGRLRVIDYMVRRPKWDGAARSGDQA